jgi:phosphoglycolate phosphatase-like HAD superfamily hydrolase
MINSQKIDQIAFDFDGVLVDSNDIKRDCFLKVAGLYDDSIRDRFDRYCKDHPGETRFEKMRWLSRAVNETTDVTSEELIDQYTYCVRSALLHADRVEALEELKKRNPNISWSIVSAAPENELKWYIEEVGWSNLFEDGVHGAPRIKKTVFKNEFDAEEREEMVFFGDSESDYRIAEALDIKFVFVSQWSRDPQLADMDQLQCIGSVSDLF